MADSIPSLVSTFLAARDAAERAWWASADPTRCPEVARLRDRQARLSARIRALDPEALGSDW